MRTLSACSFCSFTWRPEYGFVPPRFISAAAPGRNNRAQKRAIVSSQGRRRNVRRIYSSLRQMIAFATPRHGCGVLISPRLAAQPRLFQGRDKRREAASRAGLSTARPRLSPSPLRGGVGGGGDATGMLSAFTQQRRPPTPARFARRPSPQGGGWSKRRRHPASRHLNSLYRFSICIASSDLMKPTLRRPDGVRRRASPVVRFPPPPERAHGTPGSRRSQACAGCAKLN